MLLRVRREARIDHWSIHQKLSELSSEFCFIKMYHLLISVTKIIRHTFQPCGCPHFVKLCEGGELSVLRHTVPYAWKTLRKDLLRGTRLFYKLIWFPSVLAFCTLDLSELHLPTGSAWLAPPRTPTGARPSEHWHVSQQWQLAVPSCLPSSALQLLWVSFHGRTEDGSLGAHGATPLAHCSWADPRLRGSLCCFCQKRGASKPLAYVQLNTQHSTVCSAVLYHHLHLMG